MNLGSIKIDRDGAIFIGLLGLVWLMCLGMDIKLFADWRTGLTMYQHNWQGCLFFTGALIVLPFYARLLVGEPPKWLMPSPVRTR